MSLVGNFYSRITAKKVEKLVRLSSLPTISALEGAIKGGEQVQGSEILARLDGLRQKVQGHMQNLIVADAIQEIVDVLALVILGQLPLHYLEADSLWFSFRRQTRSTPRHNPGCHPPMLHTALNFTSYP